MTHTEAVQKTREMFRDLHTSCIKDAAAGAFHVNDLESYARWELDLANKSRAGQFDNSFTFRQHAHYLLTGECIALLAA